MTSSINIINNIKILQHNTAKNQLILETILEIGIKEKADILLIQEPRIYNSNSSIRHPSYINILPYKDNPRVSIYIRKESNIRFHLRLDLIDDPDLLILEINNKNIQPFYIINLYNELRDYNNKKERTIERALIPLKLDKPALIGGDFNAHHPLWNSSINHPIRATNLVKYLKDNNLELLNSIDIPTFFRPNTRSKSIIDLTFSSNYITNKVYNWDILEDKSGSDHEILSYSIIFNRDKATYSPPFKEYNLKEIDWILFNKRLKEKAKDNILFNSNFFISLKEEEDIYTLLGIDKTKENYNIPFLEDLAINLNNLIKDILEEIAPKKNITSFSKTW